MGRGRAEFAKPLYGLTPVSRVRIPPSPPVPTISIAYVLGSQCQELWQLLTRCPEGVPQDSLNHELGGRARIRDLLIELSAPARQVMSAAAYPRIWLKTPDVLFEALISPLRSHKRTSRARFLFFLQRGTPIISNSFRERSEDLSASKSMKRAR